MAKVINFPTKNKNDATHVVIAKPSSAVVMASRLGEIPIVGHALFLLTSSGCDDGLKLTQTGALNRKFVQAFWDKFLVEEDKRFRPTREFECPEATRIHQLLVYKKYVRKFKGAVKLSKSESSGVSDFRESRLWTVVHAIRRQNDASPIK